MSSLEAAFAPFRRQIIGIDQRFRTPFGSQPLVYADWTASGRLFAPIERQLVEGCGPFVGNTHSESSATGTLMTHAYHLAHAIIKEHVHAGPRDVIITAGSGMTTVVNKMIRILGLRIPEQIQPFSNLPSELRPVVFVTHMEHHSNQTSWIETIADMLGQKSVSMGEHYSRSADLRDKLKSVVEKLQTAEKTRTDLSRKSGKTV